MWSALVPLFFSSSAWRRREKRKQETWKCALSLKLVVIFHGKMQSGKKWKSLLGKHCCCAGMQTIPVTKENFFHRFSPLPRNSFLTHLKQYLELIIFHYTATRSTLDKHVAGEPFSTLNYDENQQSEKMLKFGGKNRCQPRLDQTDWHSRRRHCRQLSKRISNVKSTERRKSGSGPFFG